jgi:hypothetical protein
VGPPFTADQFFAVFADYNRACWPVAVALWLTSAMLIVLTWRRPERSSGALSVLLAAHWLWSGVAYHALFFTRINPAAWAFAALFVVQGALFAWRGRRVQYFSTPGARNTMGLALACYALAYPLLSVLFHGYPSTPTFGVPCPTAILTTGVLTTTRATLTLVVIPVLWGFIGGSAAILLDVPLDYALLASAVLLSLNATK